MHEVQPTVQRYQLQCHMQLCLINMFVNALSRPEDKVPLSRRERPIMGVGCECDNVNVDVYRSLSALPHPL